MYSSNDALLGTVDSEISVRVLFSADRTIGVFVSSTIYKIIIITIIIIIIIIIVIYLLK